MVQGTSCYPAPRTPPKWATSDVGSPDTGGAWVSPDCCELNCLNPRAGGMSSVPHARSRTTTTEGVNLSGAKLAKFVSREGHSGPQTPQDPGVDIPNAFLKKTGKTPNFCVENSRFYGEAKIIGFNTIFFLKVEFLLKGAWKSSNEFVSLSHQHLL